MKIGPITKYHFKGLFDKVFNDYYLTWFRLVGHAAPFVVFNITYYFKSCNGK